MYLIKISHEEEIAKGVLEQLESYSEDCEPPKISLNINSSSYYRGHFGQMVFDEPGIPRVEDFFIGFDKASDTSGGENK